MNNFDSSKDNDEGRDIPLDDDVALAPLGHPINILMKEHKIFLNYASELVRLTKGISSERANSDAKIFNDLKHIEENLRESEKHYLREENVLFPYLEKYGITQPVSVMWSEHNQIRSKKKEFYQILGDSDVNNFKINQNKLIEVSSSLFDLLSNHFPKENNILFPISMKSLTNEESIEIKDQFEEIGYCYSLSQPEKDAFRKENVKSAIKTMISDSIKLETGEFSSEELELILNNLPVDITFIDKTDTVKYFSQPKDRIFLRTKAVLGRKVQNCHPKESLDIVNRILDAFKNREKDNAQFWIQIENRLIFIKFYAVINKIGEYIGAIEVTQDITNLKKIEGEKRLLEWK